MAEDPIPLPLRPAPARAARPCPVCGAVAVAAHRPFCSRRCAERDLHRWLAGAYRVEGDEAPEPRPPSGRDDAG